jgi:hypothetical protein
MAPRPFAYSQKPYVTMILDAHLQEEEQTADDDFDGAPEVDIEE